MLKECHVLPLVLKRKGDPMECVSWNMQWSCRMCVWKKNWR